MPKVLALAALVAALSLSVPAATARGSLERLYVSPSGSSGSACTRSAPCRTLDRANHLARPGQIVELARGTYPGQTLTDVPGRSGRHVVFQPAAGANVQFSGRLTVDGADYLTLRRLHLHSDPAYVDDRALFIDACTNGLTLDHVTGDAFVITEGTKGILFLGGAWGGYSKKGKNDSAIGTSGAYGPTRHCGGKLAGPATGIVFDGVTFHDVFWGKTVAQWGDSHPDCFEINGFVDGVRIQNSLFTRCAGTFMQINGDQGDIVHVTFVGNLYYRLGPYSWFGIQITSEGKPGKCGSVVFRRNTYLPATPHAKTWPNGPIRTDCETVAGTKPVRVSGNLFARGPNDYDCDHFRVPDQTIWSDNLFVLGSPCGSGPSGVPYGYKLERSGLRTALNQVANVRIVFRSAAAGRSVPWILARLRRAGSAGWTESRVRELIANKVYFGGYGSPRSVPSVVSRKTWLAAQRLAR